MKFEPTEKPKMEYTVLEEGKYKFKVLEANEAISKSNNEMIKLKLQFTNDQFQTSTVYDYLVSPYPKKIMGFCQTVGLLDLYETGELTSGDCIGKEGYAELLIEESEQYGDKNKVRFYCFKPKDETKVKEEDINDPLPF